jgi:hypothetical protein
VLRKRRPAVRRGFVAVAGTLNPPSNPQNLEKNFGKLLLYCTLIKKKTKLSSHVRKFRRSGCKVIYD